MKSPKEVLGQIVGRGGRPAIVDMTVEHVRELDPGLCGTLEDAGFAEPGSCGPYLHRTVGELAMDHHLSINMILAAADDRSHAPDTAHSPEAHRPWPGPRLATATSELDLHGEIEQLRSEPAWQEFGRNAKTLVKNPDLRIVLMTFHAGAKLEQHKAPGAISIQVLAGRVQVGLPSEEFILPAGELVAIGPAIQHDLEALEPSSVLLTIAEPHAGEADAQPQHQAGLRSDEATVTSKFEAAARQAALTHLSPDEQAYLTEADLRPNFDTEVRGNCFAPIEGYTVVKSGPTSFRHHGFYVVDEPCKGMKAPRQTAESNWSYNPGAPARIPGEVVPGETPVDLASMSLMPPTPEELGIRSSVDASYPDLRHLARGGPHLASHN
ncbi:MAG TPA: cupin domain-containing protein [Chloroflexota bacterium]|nr:cupin domain-containing protein [Chloroflexota bacterium]